MEDGGRHRSDRWPGWADWTAVAGLTLLCLAVAGLVLSIALLVLRSA